MACGCELSTTRRVKNEWKKFKELLPVLLTRHLSYKTFGRVYCSCFRNAMIHASETWSLTKPDQQHLQRNDRTMISQICNVKPEDVATIRSNKLLNSKRIYSANEILRLFSSIHTFNPRRYKTVFKLKNAT